MSLPGVTARPTPIPAAVKPMPGPRGRRWFIPRPFDAVSSLIYLGVLGLFFYERAQGNYQHPWHWGQAGAMSAAILGLLLVDRAEYRRYGEAPPVRVAVALFLTRILLIEIVAQLDDFSFSPFRYLLIPFAAALYFGRRVSYAAAALVWIAYLAKSTWYQADWYASTNGLHLFLLFSVGLVFALAMAQVVADERASRTRAEQLLAALESSHMRLREYATQVEELAAARERNRLARDIHDSLGHYLTAINLQLEKALAIRAGRPADADRAVQDARGLARDALQDVRRSVRALRTPAPTDTLVLTTALTQLVDRLRDNPFTVDCHVEGQEAGFSQQALTALYRVAQEGLTNIQKHAHAVAVRVEIVFGPRDVRLLVRDDGCGFDSAQIHHPGADGGGGYGLQGARERLALVGGTLEIESQPGAGTTLRAWVPRENHDARI
jgi:signal transduction histidine kinase